MAVTVAQLAGALRLGDGTTAPAEPILSELTRLDGVADAFIELRAPGAPDAVKDEAKVRFVGYLYDQPTVSQGDRYANAWRNSGAGALVSRWVVKRSAATEREG